MNIQKLITAIALSLAGIASAPTNALASEQGVRLTRQVTYIDLDLTRTAGAATLYRRISAAADQVCAPLSGRSPRQLRQWMNCIDDSISRAVAEMDQQVLTAYHLARRGKADRTLMASR